MFLRLVQQRLSAKLCNIVGQALTLAFWGILALLQRLWKIVSLKLKLLFSLLYLLSLVYIFVRFINSLLNPWFQFCLNGLIVVNKLIRDWFCYINKIGCIGGIMNKVGFIANKVKIRVIIVLVLVLVLAKLFLNRQAICPKLNSAFIIIQSLILDSVYFIDLSSCKVLRRAFSITVFLYFLIYIL